MSTDTINTSWYPKPIFVMEIQDSICCSTFEWRLIALFAIPIFGNVIAFLAKSSSIRGKGSDSFKIYSTTEIDKCQRIGALLLMITGIALLALLSYGGQNFAIAGGTLLGIGTLEVFWLSYNIKKNTDQWSAKWPSSNWLIEQMPSNSIDV